MRRLLVASPEECGTVSGVYAKLYVKHFGCQPTADDIEEGAASFQWVFLTCHRERLPVDLWITAQMHGLRAWLRNNEAKGIEPTRFYANMLRGDNARRRYNIFVLKSERRFNRVTADAYDSSTDLANTCYRLAGIEGAVLLFLCASLSAGKAATVADAVAWLEPDLDWLALMAPNMNAAASRRRLLLSTQYGDALLFLKSAARLAGIVEVLSQFDAVLPSRISVKEPLDREALARFVADRYPRVDSEPPCIRPGQGDVWHGQ